MPAAIGSRLGHYEILALVGAGGMGEVYRARDLTLKRDVALKLLPQSFAADPIRMARFQREAEVLAALNHPNIAQIFEVVDSGEVRALAMELVEGESPRGPIPFDTAWQIASQIAAALEYAHERGIVHRDLKPANVLVSSNGFVKLLDFGLAKAFTADSRDSMPAWSPDNSPTLTVAVTQVGVITGTAAYMSPEQARGKAVDKRADIWAFGVLLYELLTGQRPFRGEDVGETLAAIIKQEPDFSVVPENTRRLLQACLEKEPRKRLRDIGDASRFISDNTAQAIPSVPSKSGSRVAVIAAVALVLGCAVGWLLQRPAPTDHRIMRFDIQPPEGGRFASDAHVMGIAVAPDGSRVAYAASGSDGIHRIWIRTFAEPAIRHLPGTENGHYPFWSPDGNALAFFNGKKLMRIQADGSGLQIVTDAPTGRGGVWLGDGRIVFGSYAAEMRIVPAVGGSAAPIAAASEGQRMQRWPQALPGGRLMYFILGEGAWVLSLNKPEDRSLFMRVPQSPVYVKGADDTDFLLWQSGTALQAQALNRESLELKGTVVTLADPVSSGATEGQIYVSAASAGPLIYNSNPRLTQFTWFDRTGRAVGTVGAPGKFHFGPFRISPDGHTVAAALDTAGNAQMVLLDVGRGVYTGVATSGNNSFPAWSPDSRHLWFGRGLLNVNSGTLDIGAPRMNAWDWSRDGRFLLTRRLVDSVRNELILQEMSSDRRTSGERKLYAEGMSGRFSPDTRWVAFVSAESGEEEIYVDSFPTAKRKVRISPSGGDYPVWSQDGRELYYVQPGNKLMAVRIATIDDSLRPGVPKQLFVLPVHDSSTWPFDVARDGRFLVRADAQQGSRSLTAILNWQSLMK